MVIAASSVQYLAYYWSVGVYGHAEEHHTFSQPGSLAQCLVAQQSVRMCVQSVAMLRNITSFHNLATQAVERTASGGTEGHKITFNVIKQRLGDVLYKITSQKFEDPADGEEAVKYAHFLPCTLCETPPPCPHSFCACHLALTSPSPVFSKHSFQKHKLMDALFAHSDEWHIHPLLVCMNISYLLLSSDEQAG